MSESYPLVTCHYFDNPDQEREAREALEPCLPFVPWWVRELHVNRFNPDGDALLRVLPQPQVRLVVINVYPSFHEHNAAFRCESMMHEVTHAVLAPLTNWVEDRLVELVGDNGTLGVVINAEFRERVECVVHDLAIGMAKLREASNA